MVSGRIVFSLLLLLALSLPAMALTVEPATIDFGGDVVITTTVDTAQGGVVRILHERQLLRYYGAPGAVPFSPDLPGDYVVEELQEGTVVGTANFTVLPPAPVLFPITTPASVTPGPASERPISAQEALSRRFPDLLIAEYPDEIVAMKGKNMIRFRGMRSESAREIAFRPGHASDIAYAEANVTDATITLARYAPIDAIQRCDIFDASTDTCSSGWERTTIPFVDDGETITFTVTHFSAYTGVANSSGSVVSTGQLDDQSYIFLNEALASASCAANISDSGARMCTSSAGSATADTYFLVNMTLPANAGITRINIKTIGRTTAASDLCEITIYNWTSGTWRNMNATAAACPSTSNTTLTVNLTTAALINNFVSGNMLRIMANTNGGSSDTLVLDYLEVNVTYYSVVNFTNMVLNTTAFIGDSVSHNATLTSAFTLGNYTFEWNATGASCDGGPQNVTNGSLSGTTAYLAIPQTIPAACQGKTIGWRIYANNSEGGRTVSSMSTYMPFGCGATITSSVTLRGNMTSSGTCFTIGADHVMIDGAGYTIRGSMSGYGIYAEGFSNITIKNFGGVNNFSTAIYAVGMNGSLVENNTINSSSSAGDGVYISNTGYHNIIRANSIHASGAATQPITISAINSTISNNLLIGTGQARAGIYMSGTNSTMNDNIIVITNSSGTPRGIYILNADNVAYRNNITVTGDGATGIRFNSANGYGYNNIVHVNGTSAIGIRFVSQGNIAENNTVIMGEGGGSIGVQFSDQNNSCIGGSITSLQSDSIAFDVIAAANNTLRNVTIVNENASKTMLRYDVAGINGTVMEDTVIGSYNISGAGGRMTFRKTGSAEIRFLRAINGTGTNLSSDIRIAYNNVTINESKSGLNKSANITFYDLSTSFNIPVIYRDGVACPASICYVFTSLNAGNVTINVTRGGSYSIQDEGVDTGLEQTAKWFVTSTTNTQTPNLSTSQDNNENSTQVLLSDTTLYSVINASRHVSGTMIRTTDRVNFSSYWTNDAAVNSMAYVTFKLYYGTAAPSTLICQSGNDNTGGHQLGDGNSHILTGNCTPSSNTTIPNGTKLWYVVNVYADNVGAGADTTLKWDTTTADTWVRYTSTQQSSVNVTANQTLYRQNQIVNVTGYFLWLNTTPIIGKNVTVSFINATGVVVQTRNVTTSASGIYSDTYALSANQGTGTWRVNVTGIVNGSINSTETTTFTYSFIGNISIVPLHGANRILISSGQNVSFMLNASCLGPAGADCGTLSIYPQYNASGGASIIYPTNTTPWRHSLSTSPLWNFTRYLDATSIIIDFVKYNDTFIVLDALNSSGASNISLTYFYPNGTVIWRKQLSNGTEANTYTSAAINGQFIVTAWENGTAQQFDVYNLDGTINWSSRFSPSGANTDGIFDIAIDNASNVFGTGTCRSCTAGNSWDIFTIKFNRTGGYQWNNTWSIFPASGPIGGWDGGRLLFPQNDGGVIIAASDVVDRLYIRNLSSAGTAVSTLNVSSLNIGTTSETTGNGVQYGSEIFITGDNVVYEGQDIVVYNVTSGRNNRNITSDGDNDIDVLANGVLQQYDLVDSVIRRITSGGSVERNITVPTAFGSYPLEGVRAKGMMPESPGDADILFAIMLTDGNAANGTAVLGLQLIDTPTSISPSASGTTFTFQLNATASGSYRINAYANSSVSDIAANTSGDIIVCVDCNPIVSSVSLTPIRARNGTIVNISATVVDESRVDTVKLLLFYPNGTAWQNVTTQNQSSTFWATINASFFPAGNYTAVIWANDSDGMTGQNTTVFAVFINGSHPANIIIDGSILEWSAAAYPDEDDNTSVLPLNVTDLNAANHPPSRATVGVAYDEKLNRSIMFGGSQHESSVCDGSGYSTCNGTYAYNHTNNRWYALNAATPPQARHSAAISYDYRMNGTLLFGGILATTGPIGCDGDSGDDGIYSCNGTYLYNASDNKWHRVPATTPPQARGGAAMAWDPLFNRTILFGGSGNLSCDGQSDSTYCNGTYAFNATDRKWYRLSVGAAPKGGVGSMVYEPTLRGMLLVNVNNGTYFLNLSTMTWTAIPSMNFSVGTKLSYDVARNLTFAFTGSEGIFAFNASTMAWVKSFNSPRLSLGNSYPVYVPALNTTVAYDADAGFSLNSNYTVMLNGTVYAKDQFDADIREYAFANNNSHLFARLRINGTTIDSTYRIYIGNGTGNTTTIAGVKAPFAYRHYLEHNGTCAVYNLTGRIGSCLAATSGTEVEFGIPLSTLNLSVNMNINLSIETSSLYQVVDQAPNAESYVEYTLYQVNPPSIVNVSLSEYTARNGTTIIVNASVYAAEGLDAVILLIDYPNGTRWQNLSMSNTSGRFNASFIATFVPSGNYTLTVWANDTRGFSGSNLTMLRPYFNHSQNATIAIDGAIADWNGLRTFADENDTIAPPPAAWQEIAQGLTNRSYAAMAYDPTINKTVLFGGETFGTNCDNGSTNYCNGTYLFNHTDRQWYWAGASNSPTPRTGAKMVFDRNINKTVLFGGESTTTNCDGGTNFMCNGTWAYNGSDNSWYALNPATPPSGRRSAMMEWDPIMNRTLLFGGTRVAVVCDSSGSNLCNGTYAYNGSDNKWYALTTLDVPTKRELAGMVYEPTLRGMLLVGGRGVTDCDGNSGSICNGTYLFNISNNTWIPLSTPGFERYDMAMVYDAHKNLSLLFGGAVGAGSCDGNNDELCNGTYAFNATTRRWFSVATIAGDGRYASSACFMPQLNGTLLVGGIFSVLETFNTTYILNASVAATDTIDDDISEYALANNASALLVRVRAEAYSGHARIYLGAGGSGTTPEGARLPFAFTHYATIGQDCVVFNTTGSAGNCTASRNGEHLEASIPLSHLNLTNGSRINITIDLVFNNRTDIAPNVDSFIEYLVATVQDSGPPVQTPSISNVTNAGPFTPLPSQNLTILVNFTATDGDGVGTINDSSAVLRVNRSGTTRTGACTPNDINSSSTTYNCSVLLTHYDPAGGWSINVSVSDTTWLNTSNATASFTYNELQSIALSPASFSFGTTTPGTTTGASANPLRIDNRGNVNMTLNITAHDLWNTTRIGAGNITVNITDALGLVLQNGTELRVPGAFVDMDNSSGDRNASFYFYLTVPIGTPSGSYTSQQNWVVTTYG